MLLIEVHHEAVAEADICEMRGCLTKEVDGRIIIQTK